VNVDWLAPVPGDMFNAACKYCSCILRAHYSDLCHHSKSRKHQRNAKAAEEGDIEPSVSFNSEPSAQGKFVVAHDTTSNV